MIFAFSTDDRCLMAFASAADAISYCEGVDVEDGGWLFWNHRGHPLEAQFSKPTRRGAFTVVSGTYTLIPSALGRHLPLIEVLNKVAGFESPAPFDSAEGVRAFLESGHA